MKDITYFIQGTLYPTLFHSIDRVFPSMSFTLRRNKWESPKNIDGSSPKTPRLDKCIITPQVPNRVLEHGEGGSKDLVTLYRELNGLATDMEAVKDICKFLGLELPEGDSEAWKRHKEQQDRLHSAHNRMKEALFSPVGREALEYLTDVRGYSRALIESMGLGYCTEDEATTLGLTNTPVGKYFVLAVPYLSGGNIYGFKFRYVTEEAKTRYKGQKYYNSPDLAGKMKGHPFGLSGVELVGEQNGIIVTEGELDTLHAISLGIYNIMASSGGKISQEALQKAKDKGADRVVFIPDNDKPGKDFTLRGIETAKALGLSVFVAELPQEYKDVDEYLKEHTGDELRGLVSRAVSGAIYQFNQIIGEYRALQEQQNGVLSDIQTADLKNRVIALTAKTEDSLDRYRIANSFADLTGGMEISRAELLEEIDKERLIDLATARNRQVEEALGRARKLQEEGKTEEALGLITATATNIQRGIDAEKVSKYLEDDIEKVFESYRKESRGIKSHLVLGNLENSKDDFIVEFPAGAISVIGAPTNHGKSKLLQSLALDVVDDMVQEKEDGCVLYVTYEENKESVIKQLLNAYIDIDITAETAKGGNIQTLTEYLHTGKTPKYMRTSRGEKDIVDERIAEFTGLFKQDLIKVIKPEDNYLSTFLSIVKYATENRNIKAVFVDYVQELYIESWKTPRTDELKEIMIDIDLVAQEANVPIIMGAQLKQETDSPLSLDTQTIADSKWIGYKASEIILFWSNKELCKNDPTEEKKKKASKEIPELDLGRYGKLYLKLTKSRLAPRTGLEAIVDIHGNSGRVQRND